MAPRTSSFMELPVLVFTMLVSQFIVIHASTIAHSSNSIAHENVSDFTTPNLSNIPLIKTSVYNGSASESDSNYGAKPQATNRKPSSNSTTSPRIQRERGKWALIAMAVAPIVLGIALGCLVLRNKAIRDMILKDMKSLDRWEESHDSDTLSSPIVKRPPSCPSRSPIGSTRSADDDSLAFLSTKETFEKVDEDQQKTPSPRAVKKEVGGKTIANGPKAAVERPPLASPKAEMFVKGRTALSKGSPIIGDATPPKLVSKIQPGVAQERKLTLKKTGIRKIAAADKPSAVGRQFIPSPLKTSESANRPGMIPPKVKQPNEKINGRPIKKMPGATKTKDTEAIIRGSVGKAQTSNRKRAIDRTSIRSDEIIETVSRKGKEKPDANSTPK